ncbi:hypothetical protein MASR1M97_13280 [Candidatus Desulfobacillus denitrificans]
MSGAKPSPTADLSTPCTSPSARHGAGGRRLNELRENWLNPPEWTAHVPEAVPGYPERIVAKPGHDEILRHLPALNLERKAEEAKGRKWIPACDRRKSLWDAGMTGRRRPAATDFTPPASARRAPPGRSRCRR